MIGGHPVPPMPDFVDDDKKISKTYKSMDSPMGVHDAHVTKMAITDARAFTSIQSYAEHRFMRS